MSLLIFTLLEPPAAPVPPPPRLAFPPSPFAALIARVDRAAFSVLGGDPAIIYTPENGVPVTIAGMFDAQYRLSTGQPRGGVETFGPALFCRLEDLPVNPEDDEPTITIAGVDYRVVERRGPDSVGGIVLVLRIR